MLWSKPLILIAYQGIASTKECDMKSRVISTHLMRMRLGCHWLTVAAGCWVDGGLPRAHIYCRKWMRYSVEDEERFRSDDGVSSIP
jgi:hypothetical protein